MDKQCLFFNKIFFEEIIPKPTTTTTTTTTTPVPKTDCQTGMTQVCGVKKSKSCQPGQEKICPSAGKQDGLDGKSVHCRLGEPTNMTSRLVLSRAT